MIILKFIPSVEGLTIKIILVFFIVICFIFSNFVRADCAANDQACINGLLSDVDNANSEAALTGGLVIAAVSWGIYAIKQ